MNRWAYLWLVLGVLMLGELLRHMHEDITAVQVRLEMLDESGRLLPEYKKW